MAGYYNFSKSNNAIEAENRGCFPSSVIERKLNLPKGFVRDTFRAAEWHHTSKMYNITNYYNLDEITELLNQNEYKLKLMAFKAAKKNNKTVIRHKGVSIKWIEWGGTRNHPKATERQKDNVIIEDKGGAFYNILLSDGSYFMRKGKTTKGFEIKWRADMQFA